MIVFLTWLFMDNGREDLKRAAILFGAIELLGECIFVFGIVMLVNLW